MLNRNDENIIGIIEDDYAEDVARFESFYERNFDQGDLTKIFPDHPFIPKSERLTHQPYGYRTCFEFINEKFSLCPTYYLQGKKQVLDILKINEFGEIEDNDEISCIHTAVCMTTTEEFNELLKNPETRNKMALKISSTENLREVKLTPEEHYVAFKSWAQGIAESGLDAFNIQGQLDEIKRAYPITKPLLQFVAKHDDNAFYDLLFYIQDECKGYKNCLISNLLPIAEMIDQLPDKTDEDKYKKSSYIFAFANITPPLEVLQGTTLIQEQAFSNRSDVKEHLKKGDFFSILKNYGTEINRNVGSTYSYFTDKNRELNIEEYFSINSKNRFTLSSKNGKLNIHTEVNRPCTESDKDPIFPDNIDGEMIEFSNQLPSVKNNEIECSFDSESGFEYDMALECLIDKQYDKLDQFPTYIDLKFELSNLVNEVMEKSVEQLLQKCSELQSKYEK
jgi:hypothetical protein